MIYFLCIVLARFFLALNVCFIQTKIKLHKAQIICTKKRGNLLRPLVLSGYKKVSTIRTIPLCVFFFFFFFFAKLQHVRETKI